MLGLSVATRLGGQGRATYWRCTIERLARRRAPRAPGIGERQPGSSDITGHMTHLATAPLVVTTAIESTWDDSHGIVWAGEWCRRQSRRHVWEPLGGSMVGSPWTRERALRSETTELELRAIRDRLVLALGQRLAEIHGLPSGDRFWRVVLGAWALFYVTEVHDRYLTARRVRTMFPDSAVTAPIAGRHWTPMTTYEQYAAFAADDYNLQLFGAVFEALGTRLHRSGIFVERHAQQPSMDTKPLAACARLISRLRAGRVAVLNLTYFPWPMVGALACETLCAALPVPRLRAPRAPRDDGRRRLLGGLSLGDGEFEGLLSAMVVNDLPTVFLEGMAELVRTAQRAFPSQAAAWFSATGWYFDEPFKLAAAFAAEGGAQLLGTQHGGNYGIDAVNPVEDLELSLVDHYYTWGWRRPDSATPTSVMPATKFTARSFARATRPCGALLVTTTTYTRYNSATGAWFEACLAWQERFAKALGEEGRAHLRVRLHKDDHGWDMASRWARFAPDVEIERQDAVRFEDSVRGSRVIVCDHLSTTYAQSIVTGRPTVLFWDPATEFIRPEALPVFERLREVGVLCSTPEQAAETVLQIRSCADDWWADRDRRAAVAAFVKKYALVVPDARAVWARELRRRACRRR